MTGWSLGHHEQGFDDQGTSITLMRGTMLGNICLTDDEEDIEGNGEKVRGLVFKTCPLKTA